MKVQFYLRFNKTNTYQYIIAHYEVEWTSECLTKSVSVQWLVQVEVVNAHPKDVVTGVNVEVQVEGAREGGHLHTAVYRSAQGRQVTGDLVCRGGAHVVTSKVHRQLTY